MYQALYRKWRPRSFDDVVGQAHITETLKRQVSTGRLSHAYLFVGTRGTGKTTCAKILSRAVNCEHPENGSPCNTCRSCTGIENGSILDVVELDAASNNGVDNVRALREEAIFTPVSVRKRVYIIDEVHMLSTAAFNALLKILEEPPEHLVFILATTEIQKVPATILSRCQRFTFKRILPADIAGRLSYVADKEGLNLTPEAANLLAQLADGSMRDGLSLLDQCAATGNIDVPQVLSSIGLAGKMETQKLLSSISRGNVADALKLLDGLYQEGKNMAAVLEELSSLVRDMLVSQLTPRGGAGLLSAGCDTAALKELSSKFTSERLIYSLDTIKDAERGMAGSSNPKTDVELCLIRLCDDSLSVQPSALLSRISKLEESAVRQPATSRSETGKAESQGQHQPSDSSDSSDNIVVEDTGVPEKPKKVENAAGTAVHSVTPPSGDFWRDILVQTQPKIDIPIFTFLSDDMLVSAAVEGDELLICAKNPFVAQMIDMPKVVSVLKESAMAVFGHPVVIRVTTSEVPGGLKKDKLNALSKFDNFKIED